MSTSKIREDTAVNCEMPTVERAPEILKEVLPPPFGVHEAVSWVVSLAHTPKAASSLRTRAERGPLLSMHGQQRPHSITSWDAIAVVDAQASHRPAQKPPSEFCRCRPTFFGTSDLLCGISQALKPPPIQKVKVASQKRLGSTPLFTSEDYRFLRRPMSSRDVTPGSLAREPCDSTAFSMRRIWALMERSVVSAMNLADPPPCLVF